MLRREHPGRLHREDPWILLGEHPAATRLPRSESASSTPNLLSRVSSFALITQKVAQRLRASGSPR